MLPRKKRLEQLARGRRVRPSRSSRATASTATPSCEMLRVARRLGEDITVRTTFLGAHALPPEYEGRADDYIDFVCDEVLPAAAKEGLVDAVDAFCERIAFNRLPDSKRSFETAKELRPAGEAARRSAFGLPAARRSPPSSARCRPTTSSITSEQGIDGDGAGGHRRSAACRARSTSCARRSCRRSTALRRNGVSDRARHRPQPRHFAALLAAPAI